MPLFESAKFAKEARDGKLKLGITNQTGSLYTAEMASGTGMDFVVIDSFHRGLTHDGIRKMVTASQSSNIGNTVSLVRVAGPHDRAGMQQTMDIGGDGVIIPNVRNKKEAMEAASVPKYPGGGGTRSLYMPIRAQLKTGPLIGLVSFAKVPFIACETSTVEQINNSSEIASVPLVSALFVDCLQLAASMDLFANVTVNDGETYDKFVERLAQIACNNSKVIQALANVVESAKRNNKAAGCFSPSAEMVPMLKKMGFNVISVFNDVRPMTQFFENFNVSEIEKVDLKSIGKGKNFIRKPLKEMISTKNGMEILATSKDGCKNGAIISRTHSCSDIERLIGSGVDCLVFDLVNHNFTYKQMEAQIFTALTFNIPCVARCRHYDQIQRSLTAGCDGIIVPGNDDKINKCMDMSEFSKLRGLAMLPTTIYKRSFQTKPVILVEGKTLLFDGKTMKSDTLTASYVQVPDTVPEMIKNRIEKQNQKQAKFKADALTGGICQTGLFINSASHEVILGLGLLGYTWMLADFQHSPYDQEMIEGLYAAAHLSDSMIFSRVGGYDDSVGIGMCLDLGFDGALIPYVNNAKEGQIGIDLCKLGKRRMNLFQEEQKLRNNLVLFQVETAGAMHDIDALLKLDGLDIAFVGPGDLSMSIGLHERYSLLKSVAGDEVGWCLDTVYSVCKKYGVVPGGFSRGGPPIKFMSREYRFCTWGSDLYGFYAGLTGLYTGNYGMIVPDVKSFYTYSFSSLGWNPTKNGMVMNRGQTRNLLMNHMVPHIFKHSGSRGKRYDISMPDQFFSDIGKPNNNKGTGSGGCVVM